MVKAVTPKGLCFQAAAISVHSKDEKQTSKRHTDMQGQRPCGQTDVSFRAHLKAKLMMLKMDSRFSFFSLYTPAAGVFLCPRSCFHPSPSSFF